MKYRHVDGEKASEAVAKSYARDAEVNAYAMEFERDRLGDDAPAEVVELADERRKAADDHRKKAGLTDKEVVEARREWLDKYVVSLETEHVSHVAKLGLKKGRGLADDEPDVDGISVADHERDISVIEAAHAKATAELDALAPKKNG